MNSSLIALFQSTTTGGRGGDGEEFCEWNDSHAGDGRDGFYMSGGSSAIIAGQVADKIVPSMEGYGDCFPSGPFDGSPGAGLVVQGSSSVRGSGVEILSQSVDTGSVLDLPVVDDPFLERTGTLQAGRVQTFWIYGTSGDAVTFILGRAPAITVDADQPMDNLVSHERAYDLGPIPATGRKKFNFTIPTTFPTGFNFYTQAMTTNAGGVDLLTNSVPLVLRY